MLLVTYCMDVIQSLSEPKTSNKLYESHISLISAHICIVVSEVKSQVCGLISAINDNMSQCFSFHFSSGCFPSQSLGRAPVLE